MAGYTLRKLDSAALDHNRYDRALFTKFLELENISSLNNLNML